VSRPLSKPRRSQLLCARPVLYTQTTQLSNVFTL
jgi:hypothetical protein